MIKNNKRFFSMILVVLLVAGGILSGCSKPVPGEGNEGEGQADLTADTPAEEEVRDSVAPASIKMNGQDIDPFEYDYTFYSTYVDYISLIPQSPDGSLDLNSAVPEEMQMGESTWHDAVLKQMQVPRIFLAGAQEKNMTLTDEDREQIQTIQQSLSQLATQNNTTEEELLISSYGPLATVDKFMEIQEMMTLAGVFYADFMEEIEATPFTEEEQQAYYDENKELADSRAISTVRHILISLEEGASEEDDAKAKADAEAVLAKIQSGEDMETLGNEMVSAGTAAEAAEYDVDIDTQFVPEFKEWTLDDARVADDVSIVKTVYGYHVIKFIERDMWAGVKDLLISEKFTAYVDEKAALPEFAFETA